MFAQPNVSTHAATRQLVCTLFCLIIIIIIVVDVVRTCVRYSLADVFVLFWFLFFLNNMRIIFDTPSDGIKNCNVPPHTVRRAPRGNITGEKIKQFELFQKYFYLCNLEILISFYHQYIAVRAVFSCCAGCTWPWVAIFNERQVMSKINKKC